MRGGARSLADLTTSLTGAVNRIVIDRTGLTGTFDFTLRWTPESLRPQSPDSPGGLQVVDAPSLFSAIQEQLGLKLESSRGPVEMLVIESVQQPTPN